MSLVHTHIKVFPKMIWSCELVDWSNFFFFLKKENTIKRSWVGFPFLWCGSCVGFKHDR